MIDNKKEWALITGASSGIGYELAKVFARHGRNIVIVSRDEAKLKELKQEIEREYYVKLMMLPKDLADPRSPTEIFEELEKRGVNIQILVNNAGFSIYGMFSETDLQKELEIVQVNLSSLIHLTKLILPGMLKRRSGKILNVASMGAFHPGPYQSVYCATKAGVLSFSQALSNELQGTGITVTCLCPGVVKTEFHQRAGMQSSKLMNEKMIDAGVMAEAGYRALMAEKVIAVPGFKFRLGSVVMGIIPRTMLTKIARSVVEPKC